LPTEGLVSMTGTIKQNDKDYLVSRTLFFTIKKSGLKNNYKVEISREEIDKRDELPEDLWLKYVFPKSTGVEFYSEVRELNKNAILLQSLSNPLLVCVRTEN
ncbi:MAG: FidL-like protein, partial [Shewanella oncorhynchi]